MRVWFSKVRWSLGLLGSTSAVALLAASPSPACAQENQGAAASELEAVTVTARRREENVQSTPVSVSAFSGAALEERNVQTAADVTRFVPNVQFDSAASESGGGASSQISIRGIGQTDYVLTVEPAVGVYLDGVYIGKSMGSLLDAVDLERLEVLRGPQGTLFGKNTIGGAIQLISKRPTSTLEYSGQVTTGSFTRLDGKAAISGPVSDAVRVRLSGAYQSRDGFVKRVSPTGVDTGSRQGDMDRLSGRFAVEADLSANLLATLSLDGTRIREHSPGQILVKADETAGFASAYNAGVPGGVCLAGAARLSNPFCYNSQWVRPLDSRQTTNIGPNRSNTDVIGAGLTLDWKLGAATVKSITAWRKVDVDVLQDLTASPYYYNFIGQQIDTKQFSQEFQVLGDALDARLHYVFGLYYLHEAGRQAFPVELSLVQFISGGRIRNDSYAAFGQFTYDLTDKFSLTGGLRYSNETRRFNPQGQVIQGYASLSPTPVPGFVNVVAGAFGPAGTPLFPAGWYSRSDESVTPMVSVNYKFSRDVMAYASFSKGQKGGGFTMRYFPPVIPAAGTDPNTIVSYAGPEKASSYEVGLKSEFLDRRVRLNIAAFYTDYKDIQITYNVDPDGAGPIGPFVPVLANAGSARIEGVEAEGSAALTHWLRLDASAGYTDAEYKSFSAQARANYPGIDDFKVPNTPKWTFNIGGVATLFDDDDKGRAQVRVDYAYRSGQSKEFANDPTLYQKGFGLLNASLTYRLPNKRVEASIGGTNLTDKTYIVSGVSNGGIGYAQAVVSRPREWFASLKYQY